MEFKFKKGDKIKCIDSIIGCSEGKIYTLIKDSHWIEFKDDDGSLRARSIDGFELVKDTPKPKFKIGDKVEVFGKRELNFTCKEGRIVNKNKIEDCWNVKAISGKSDSPDEENWVYEGDMRLVEEGCSSCEVEDRGTSLPKDFGVLRTGLIGELGGYEYYNNEPSNSSGNKVGKIMSKVSEFVKNSLLSKEEKLLRKYGLKDSCGDYTDEAEELVIAKLIKDNEAYLIEVATAMEVEEKKNK